MYAVQLSSNNATPFTPFWYSYDNICEIYFSFWSIGSNTSTFKKWRIVSISSSLKKKKNITYYSFFWCEKSQCEKSHSSWRSFHFSVLKCDLLLFFWLKEVYYQSITCQSLYNWAVLVGILINVKKNCVTFKVAIFSILPLEYVISI